jgi:Pyrimidine dimer DNA glycosylase
MQLFMPYPDLAASAAALDPVRLGKQRLEAYECAMQARSHPCATAWAGHEAAAMHFARLCSRRYTSFTRKNGVPYDSTKMLAKIQAWEAINAAGPTMPTWFGNEEVHVMYQRWLTRKNPDLYGPIFGVEPWHEEDFPWRMLVPGWVRAGARRG